MEKKSSKIKQNYEEKRIPFVWRVQATGEGSIKCKNKNWKFRYLGFGNIEGELVVKLFLLNGDLEKLREYYSEKNPFLMLVYENGRT